MRINNNVAALNTHRSYTINNNNQAKSLEKLSSGYRINRAGDDAAGLAISEKMRGQIRGLSQASRNAQDGISMVQTAEGAMNEMHSILQRMRELSVQGANATNTDEDRANITSELVALKDEINRIAENTEFNSQSLLGTAAGDVNLHVGANTGQSLTITFTDMHASVLDGNLVSTNMTLSSGVSVADALIGTIDKALATVSTERADLGAIQNRLEHTIANLDTAAENLQASESRIRDVDMAKEMSEYTKQNILSQAATSMLAQANQAPQGVLQLLQ